MKKRMAFLLLALALGLSLCATAAAAEPSLSGTLGDRDELSWVLEDGTLSVRAAQAGQDWTGQVMAACYSGGRFSQVRVLTPDKPTAQVGDRVGLVKLFWLGEETFAPQCAPAQTPVTPDRVFTGGINLYDAINRNSINYVAPDYAADCEYYLNGAQVASTALNTSSIGRRGTVVEFYLNASGQIAVVKAYTYIVDKVEGKVETQALPDGTVQVCVPGLADGLSDFVDADKVSGWEDLEEGDVVLYYVTTLLDGNKAYTIEKAKMITGTVTTYSTNGNLTLSGTGFQRYSFSSQTINYESAPISEDIFKNWTSYYSLRDKFNFWLDKNGDIAVAQQLTVPQDFEMVCLVDETEVVYTDTDGNYLAARLVFEDSFAKIDRVSKVATGGGELKSVVEVLSADPAIAASQITVKDAQMALAGDTENSGAMTKFFHCRSTSDGYELTELCEALNGGRDWENVVTADGVIPITKTTNFAQGLDLFANSQTVFIVGKYNVNDGNVVYQTYKGFKNVPEMDATRITAIAANVSATPPGAVNTVAKYVYLETGAFKIAPPDGYILIAGNEWMIDPDLYEEDVYCVNIVDTDGTTCKMRVDPNLREAVSLDSIRLDGQADTIFKFWAVKEIDENGVVTALGDADGQPAELKNVTALGKGVLTLDDSQTYVYDDDTKFIYVDLGWADDQDDVSNMIGVREPDRDIWAVNGSGTFDPESFFDAADVDATDGSSASYISVQAAVIADPNGSSRADYVYVLRKLW